MCKDPAFLFYPNDYIGGTMGMTFEEKGAYVELLMCQFNRGHMTSHMCGQLVGQLWDNIKHKFVQDENGLYYNIRLEEEINKRKAYTNSRKNNISGKNQYTKKCAHINGHMTSHMENENVNINNNLSNKEKRKSKIKQDLFLSKEWDELWENWIDYKKTEKRQTYKTAKSELIAYKELLKISGNNIETAKKIVSKSIANLYTGLFELKETQLTQQQPSREQKIPWI